MHHEIFTFKHSLLWKPRLCVILERAEISGLTGMQSHGQNSGLPEGWNHGKNKATEGEGAILHPDTDGLSSLSISALMPPLPGIQWECRRCSHHPTTTVEWTKHRNQTNTEEIKLFTRSTPHRKFEILGILPPIKTDKMLKTTINKRNWVQK